MTDRFSPSTVDQILSRTNQRGVRFTRKKKKELAYALETAAATYFVERQISTYRTDNLTPSEFKRIADTGKKLLRLLSIPEGEIVPWPADEVSPEEWADQAKKRTYQLSLIEYGFRLPVGTKDSIARLIEWSCHAPIKIAGLGSRTPKGRKRDYALDEFLRTLCDIWVDFFEDIPSVSTIGGASENYGKPGGPFYRFAVACCGELSVAESGLFDRLRRLLGSKGKKAK